MGSILCLITSGFYDGNKSIYVLGWCGQIGAHGLTENVTYWESNGMSCDDSLVPGTVIFHPLVDQGV